MDEPQPESDRNSSSESGSFPAPPTPESPSHQPPSETRRDEFLNQSLPHLDALYRYAGTLRLTQWDVEQLLQDTFLVAFEDFRADSMDLDLKTKLFEILRFLYERNYRSSVESTDESTREDEVTLENRSRELAPDVLEELDEEFFSEMTVEELNRAFNSLPQSCLSCVELVDVEEFSYEQVSEILNRPPQSVMSELHRGRNILKKELVENA